MARIKPNRKGQNPVELDGRTLEGGGQLIRMALCLSALTGVPVKIDNTRGNRSSGGGLKAQHLACVNWLAHASNATVEGAEKGSKTLLFCPGDDKTGQLSPAFKKKSIENGGQVYECKLDIGTAGSTGLALQAILPFILFYDFPSKLPVHLTLNGGTNVSGSPSYEYLTHVLLPTLSHIRLPNINSTLHKRGWSHGGGSIGSFTLAIPPRQSTLLPTFTHSPSSPPKKPSKPTSLTAIFLGPSTVHDHFRTVLPPALSHNFHLDPSQISITAEASLHEKRFYLILIAHSPHYTLASDWLYDRKIKSLERTTTEMVERVAHELANEWDSGAFVDEHLRDQLVIFQALAEGKCRVWAGRDEDGEVREPSLHARTAEWVAREMLGVRFDSEGVCEGVAFGQREGNEVEELAGNVGDVSLARS